MDERDNVNLCCYVSNAFSLWFGCFMSDPWKYYRVLFGYRFVHYA